MEKLVIRTLQSKYLWWPALIILFAFSIIIIRFASIPDKTIFPNADQYICIPYTDKDIGGNSAITNENISDSIAQISFNLGLGINMPYAGLSIYPSKAEFINASGYNQINISIAGKELERVSIGLHTLYKDPKNANNEAEDAIHHKYIGISESKAIYKIPINQLKLPEWWVDVHQMIDPEDYTPDLTHITNIAVNSAYTPDFEKQKTIAVYSITFTRNISKLILFFGFVFILTVLLLYITIFWIQRKKEKVTGVTINYKPVDIASTNHESIDCIDYINTHYSNCELSLSIISRETGLPERQIANTINQKFNCNFKTYLNQIRITESKRLLKGSNLSKAEIAFEVGFNTQSHFNRVFKSLEGVNPSDFKTTDN